MMSIMTSQSLCSDEPSNMNTAPKPMTSCSQGEAGNFDDDSNQDTQTHIRRGDWIEHVRETVVSTGPDGLLHITVLGGADTGCFCWIGGDPHIIQMVKCHSGKIIGNEILLEIDGEQVAGYTLGDLLRLLWSATDNGQPVLLKTISTGHLTTDLKLYLNRRFQKGSIDHGLQKTIRSNIYRRTLPCTTRNPRQGEVDGLQYRFLSVDEFVALEQSGGLLESGIYEGNYYGTPVPPKDPNGPQLQWNASLNTTGSAVPGNDVVQTAPNNHARLNSLSTSSEHVTSSTEAHSQQQRAALDSQSNSSNSISTERDSVDDQAQWTSNSMNYHHNSDLPEGWERIVDPVYGVYFIDHINKRTQYENPLRSPKTDDATVPNGRTRRLVGQLIHVELMKSPTGLGFTIVASEDEFSNLLLQIKTILPDGPASSDGRLRPGDVLVRVDGRNIVGFTHQDVAELFRSIQVGCRVHLDVCRGKYPLPFDPGDSQTQIITTIAVARPEGADNSRLEGALCSPSKQTTPICNGHIRSRSYDVTTNRDVYNRPGRRMVVNVSRRTEGVGFSVTTSGCRQIGVSCVRDVVESRCTGDLRQNDVLLTIDGVDVSRMTPPEVMNVLKNCRLNGTIGVTIYRPASSSSSDSPGPDVTPVRPPSCCLFPVTTWSPDTASAQSCGSSTRTGPIISSISGTPDFIPASAYHGYSPEGALGNDLAEAQQRHLANEAGNSSVGRSRVERMTTADIAAGTVIEKTICLRRRENGFGFRIVGGAEEGTQVCVGYLVPGGAADREGLLKVGDVISAVNGDCVRGASHHDVVRYIGESANQRGHVTLTVQSHLDVAPSGECEWYQTGSTQVESHVVARDVTLMRRVGEGYGFVIVSSLIKSGSIIGRLTPGGPADRCGQLRAGDRILAVNGIDISAMQHHEIVELIRSASDLRLVLTVAASPAETPQHTAPSGGDDQQLELIELTRGSRGFGFSIRGGIEFGDLPLLVLKIADGGAAFCDGRLRVNDEILEINGIDTRGKTHSHALDVMQSGGPSIKLLVRHAQQAIRLPKEGTSFPVRERGNLFNGDYTTPPESEFTRSNERLTVPRSEQAHKPRDNVESSAALVDSNSCSSSDLPNHRQNNRQLHVDQVRSNVPQCDSLDGSTKADTKGDITLKNGTVSTTSTKLHSGSLV